MVGTPGFEPGKSPEPESGVLPLHYVPQVSLVYFSLFFEVLPA